MDEERTGVTQAYLPFEMKQPRESNAEQKLRELTELTELTEQCLRLDERRSCPRDKGLDKYKLLIQKRKDSRCLRL